MKEGRRGKKREEEGRIKRGTNVERVKLRKDGIKRVRRNNIEQLRNNIE
ncbi:MAG: hypothetical protein FWH55_02185 [Oscillospiraceae bacterium]|nr:hypothetical protein [Oscillospiraceae bacterium]